MTCRGACCEEMQIPDHGDRDDASRWFALHGNDQTKAGYVIFETRCAALDTRGLCTIYETRPQVCRLFKTGRLDCLEVVRRRRSHAEYDLIRENGDPQEIHGDRRKPLHRH